MNKCHPPFALLLLDQGHGEETEPDPATRDKLRAPRRSRMTTTSRSSRRSGFAEGLARALPFLLLAFLAGLFIYSTLVNRYPWLNHDVGWFLYSARKILAGDRLYLDWIEWNPPAIHMAMYVVVGLARRLGLSDIGSVYVFVVGLGSLRLLLPQVFRGSSRW